MPERLVVDLSKPSGEQETRVPLTAEELAAWEDEQAEGAADLAAMAALAGNETTLRDRAETALANLQAAWDGWSGLSAAQKDAALKLQVRVTIALVRLVLRRLDST